MKNVNFGHSAHGFTITSSGTGFRYLPADKTFDTSGLSIFLADENLIPSTIGLLNSSYARAVLRLINPTLHVNPRDTALVPVCSLGGMALEVVTQNSESCIRSCIADWNAYERSLDLQSLPMLTATSDPTPTLESSYAAWTAQNRQTITEMKRLEEENNRLFIDAYGLQEELTPEVPIEQITLTVNPAYRYGKKLSDDDWSVEHGFPEDLETRFREDGMQELVSYAIGCAMGRYSLDEPGLIYAHSGNQGFDPSHYRRFPADGDGILPITDSDWFEDDAANRLVEFMAVAFGKEVASGEWRVANGEWRVASGEWRVKKTTRCQRLATHHSPLTTHHFLKRTCNS